MKYKRREQVDFMVASAANGYMNILRRDLVDNLVEKVFLGNSPKTRSSIPNFLVDIWRLDKKVKYVHLPGTSHGLLYVMRSPYFRIEQYDPLQFMAIGEGKTVMQALDYYDDAIYALKPGDSFAEASQFRQTIQRFISEQESIKSVGGLYPVIKVTGRGIENMGMGATIPVGGNRIQLSHEGLRWVQRNITEGKDVQLLYPWELDPNGIRGDMAFNDYDEALRRFRKGE